MRIGIDVYSFDNPGENYGVGPSVYVWRLLPELFTLGKNHEFTVFANNDNCALIPRLPNVSTIVSPVPNRVRILRVVHEQLFVPLCFLRGKLDIVHFLGNNISFLLARRSILTVYDLMWKYYYHLPGYRSLKHFYFAATVPWSLRKASALITISTYVANQIRSLYAVDSYSVFPIPLCSGGHSKISPQREEEFRKKYDFPFLFTLTTSMPHKNLGLLLEAFWRLRQNGAFQGKLVVAGQLKGGFHAQTWEFIRTKRIEREVVIAGFISEEEKAYCYRHAVLFVYPSLYEGFGLPILEAMEAGVPVVSSNAAAIPEVGSDACLYFDPMSIRQLEDVLVAVLTNPSLQQALRDKGIERSRHFSWRRTAEQTLEVYRQCFPPQPPS